MEVATQHSQIENSFRHIISPLSQYDCFRDGKEDMMSFILDQYDAVVDEVESQSGYESLAKGLKSSYQDDTYWGKPEVWLQFNEYIRKIHEGYEYA